MECTLYEGPLKPHLEKHFGLFSARLLVGEERLVRSPPYPRWATRQREFTAKGSDVWVVTYPKAGTTWTQEIVWGVLNDFESKEAKQLLMNRFPFFEWDSLLPQDASVTSHLEEDDPCRLGVTWDLLHTLPEPRTIKSHLHLELLPDSIWSSKAKVIYVCRDPRDVCVSYYYHSVKLLGFGGQFEDYLQIFINDLSFCSPFWKHVLSFWQRRHDQNIMFIRYEELQENTTGMIKKISQFLGKSISDDYIEKLSKHVSFSSMKENRAVNNESIFAFENERSKNIKFMRNGKVGDWRNHFSEAQKVRFQQWVDEGLKHQPDFTFYRD